MQRWCYWRWPCAVRPMHKAEEAEDQVEEPEEAPEAVQSSLKGFTFRLHKNSSLRGRGLVIVPC